MVDGVKIVMEDQSSRVEIQREENDEAAESNEDTNEKYSNNTLYEEIKYEDCNDDFLSNFGFDENENSQTDFKFDIKMKKEPMKSQIYDDDFLLQNMPEDFNIGDEETNRIIEDTLEAFLHEIKRKKKRVSKVTEANETDCGVNENENSYIELQFPKSSDVRKDRSLDRYTNVSRRKITKEEMEQMLDRERENNCYKNAYFKCEKCVYGYDNVNQYTDHLVKHDEKQGPEVCTICEQRFAKKKTAVDHYLHHFMVFYCTECGYTSRFLRFLKAHQERGECGPATPTVWFYCTECDHKFALESLLTHHMKSIHQLNYSCKYCSKTFAKDINRKIHEQDHKGRQSVQCDICNKSFVNIVSFQFHLKNVHNFSPREIRRKKMSLESDTLM